MPQPSNINKRSPLRQAHVELYYFFHSEQNWLLISMLLWFAGQKTVNSNAMTAITNSIMEYIFLFDAVVIALPIFFYFGLTFELNGRP
jgi:hypothetical protein